MAIEDNASIALIPSGYKSGKLYSVIPDSGNGDFTHTRATTATRVGANGLIESVASGVPRLDYPLIDGVVQSCPALLLEPSRTNSLFYSEEFDNSTYYTHTNCTVTSSSGTAPDGTNNARKLQDTVDTVNTSHNIQTKSAYAGTIAYDSIKTGSVFVKAGTKKFVQIRLTNETGTFSYIMGNFDLENETILAGASANASDVSYGLKNYGNGWYRCIVRGAWTDSSVTKTGLDVLMGEENSDPTQMHQYIGDGTGTLFVWGGQVEEGNFETSYIPSSGSTETRNAEDCDGAGTSAEFNDTEGVLFVEAGGLDVATDTRLITISDSDTSSIVNSIRINWHSSTSLFFQKYAGSTRTTNVLTTIARKELVNKIAVKYNATSFDVFINGTKAFEEDDANAFTGSLNTLSLTGQTSTTVFTGKVKQVMVFNEALTDSQLETLTSWDSFSAMAKSQEFKQI